jgi:hypothetical protein
MKITRNQLRSFIIKELKESLANWHSEVKYAKDPHSSGGRSRKRVQRAFNRADRAATRDHIESQLASMEIGPEDDRAIGEIVPIGPEEWASYDGISSDPGSNVPSEKESYLYDLAWDYMEGRVDMSDDDVAALDILILDAFGWSFAYGLSGYGTDLSAEASRDETYDQIEAERLSQYDESD